MAEFSGGAIHNENDNNLKVVNSIFINNQADVLTLFRNSYGGAIYNSGDSFSVGYSTFISNQAIHRPPFFSTSEGGAIYIKPGD